MTNFIKLIVYGPKGLFFPRKESEYGVQLICKINKQKTDFSDNTELKWGQFRTQCIIRCIPSCRNSFLVFLELNCMHPHSSAWKRAARSILHLCSHRRKNNKQVHNNTRLSEYRSESHHHTHSAWSIVTRYANKGQENTHESQNNTERVM